MTLVGIIDSAEFKNKVLHQRELLKTEGPKDHNQHESKDGQIIKLLTEIKDVLTDIKNNNPK